MSGPSAAPAPDCPLCPRLAGFRRENRARYPDWHNAPVDSFGPRDAPLLIIGLAPGLRGANRTGRPFTGDWAGDLLYATLLKYRFGSLDQSHPLPANIVQLTMLGGAALAVMLFGITVAVFMAKTRPGSGKSNE